jgi:hypothetical protein
VTTTEQKQALSWCCDWVAAVIGCSPCWPPTGATVPAANHTTAARRVHEEEELDQFKPEDVAKFHGLFPLIAQVLQQCIDAGDEDNARTAFMGDHARPPPATNSLGVAQPCPVHMRLSPACAQPTGPQCPTTARRPATHTAERLTPPRPPQR